jgi:hypothetical protein
VKKKKSPFLFLIGGAGEKEGDDEWDEERALSSQNDARAHLGDFLAVEIVSRLGERLQAEWRADHDEEKRYAE